MNLAEYKELLNKLDSSFDDWPIAVVDINLNLVAIQDIRPADDWIIIVPEW